MNTTNLSDGARSPDAIRSYVHLADGRRLSYTKWGQPAGRPVLEFRGLPGSHTGDAIDMAVLARAGVRRITVVRPGVDPPIRRQDAPCGLARRRARAGQHPWARQLRGAWHIRKQTVRRRMRLCAV